MVKYYFRKLAKYTDELYSVIYLHRKRLHSYGLVCDFLTGQFARGYSRTMDYTKDADLNVKDPVSYDLSYDLRVNRVNDLCKKNKWEI